MLYVETVSSLMYDVSRLLVPSNISDLFTKVNKILAYKTRSCSSGNFYIKSWSLSRNHWRSFARFGAKPWNSYRDKFRQLPKTAFKKHVHDLLLLIMEAEDNYVEMPILLYKIAKFLCIIEMRSFVIFFLIIKKTTTLFTIYRQWC